MIVICCLVFAFWGFGLKELVVACCVGFCLVLVYLSGVVICGVCLFLLCFALNSVDIVFCF